MKILSGVQPSGKIHLGNYLGAVKQHIDLQKSGNEVTLFIADLHALTTVKDPIKLRDFTLEVARSYLALGLDSNKTTFFKQSDVPAHSELFWILTCLTRVPFLERAHAFKDAKAKGKKEITVGLFNYPILQAADILLYSPDIVPVGQDQKQHIEMARDIAIVFNELYKGKGDKAVFKLPQPKIESEVAVVPGTDGQKMSKSYGNTIDIFAPEEILKQQVMSIVTDSTPLEEPKDYNKCHVFALYKLLAQEQEINTMKKNYKNGGYGYGHAKKELLNKIIEHFGEARKKYETLAKDDKKTQKILEEGQIRANKVAEKKLAEVKKAIGLS